MYEFIRACDTEILQFFKANFFSNIIPKEPVISPITKFHKLFKCFLSICV